MPKYNYHEIKEQVKRGDSLPADINQPVKDYLKKIGADKAIETIERKERLVQYGKVIVFNMKNPFKRIEIKTSLGMIEGYDKIEEKLFDDGFCVIDETHIKNDNLYMKKESSK